MNRIKKNYLSGFENYIKKNIGKKKIILNEVLTILKCSRSTLNQYCRIKFNMTPREHLREIKKKTMIDSVLKANNGYDANFCYAFYSSFSREFKK